MRRGGTSSGSVLLGVLMLVSLILLCVLQRFLYLQKTLRFFGEELRIMPLREEARITAFERAAEMGAVAGLSCSETQREDGATVIHRQVCGLWRSPDPSQFSGTLLTGSDSETYLPLIHYNDIFESVSDCESIPDDGSGLPLSQSAARSARLCVLSAMETAAFKVRANIRAAAPLVLQREGDRASLLAAAGYLSAAAIHVSEGGALIVAGGDLMIGHLVIRADQPPDIVLVSASGIVKIEKISGTMKLKSISWLGSYLPGGHAAAESAVLPPRLERLPLFVAGGDPTNH